MSILDVTKGAIPEAQTDRPYLCQVLQQAAFYSLRHENITVFQPSAWEVNEYHLYCSHLPGKQTLTYMNICVCVREKRE